MLASRDVALFTFLLIGVASPAWALPAATPDDICAPTDDPCVVSTNVVLGDSDFDFGVRTLRIAAGGKLDAGAAHRTIACGGLAIDEGGTFRMTDGRYGGWVRLFVNGHCADSPSIPCADDFYCPGSACVGGDADISGRIDGRALTNSNLDLEAAGAIALHGLVDFRARSSGASPSRVSLRARKAIFAAGTILARRRGNSFENSTHGSEVELSAGGDATVTDVVIDARGGDKGGGRVEVTAGGNLAASGEFRLNATGGAGWGGYVGFVAEGDVSISGQSDGRPTTFDLRGHGTGAGEYAFHGDGGWFHVAADGNATVSEQVEVRAQGSENAFGGLIEVIADEAVTLGGSFSLAPSGIDASGGEFYIDADGPLVIPSTTTIDIGAASGGNGGTATMYAGGPVEIHGKIFASAKLRSGSIAVHGRDDVTITGEVRADGIELESSRLPILVEGCDVSIAAQGLLSTTALAKGIRVASRESMLIESGAGVLASGTGASVELAYRDPSKPPSVLGTVAPAASIFIDDTLAACP